MGENKGSKLYVTSILDVKDDLEEKMERCHETVKQVTNGLSERESHDALIALVCKGQTQHEEITVGLLYSILTEPQSAAKVYRDLSMISRDGMMLAWSRVNQLIVEKFIKLQEVTRTQAVWITTEMVKNAVTGVDNVCSSLIKQIAGGDLSPKNIWLAESMLDLCMENRAWLEKFPVLMCMALFTYLRVIEDHNVQTLTTLRQREVEFCITLLRNKFMECCRIGRDLLRLLQNVARIAEFEQLWKDILHKPQTINPQFGGVPHLMGQRTSPKYLACRLTPDMEKKIIFLTSKVKFGQQKRYQDWFQKQYLSTPESQSLRCDLIRYICCAVHPSNEVLCSDVIQRWAVIGWLLTTCTSNVAASSAKLALFYDWLFFNQARANIMDIEPAILVMHHSMRSHPAITATLLDFLCRIIPNFYPLMTSQVKTGVMTSLRFILDKRVLPSLSPLFDNPKLDKELRAMIRDTFAEFCSVTETPPVPSPKTEIPPSIPAVTAPIAEVKELEVVNETPPPAIPVRNRLDSVEGTFSDEEEEEKVKPPDLKPKESVFRPIKEEEEEDMDLDQYLDQLDGDIKDLCEKLQEQRDADLEAQCETMENLCGVILESNDFDSDTASPLASFLTFLYDPHMSGEILPEEISQETMEDSLGKPIYVIFRNLSQDTEEDSCPLQLLTLVCIMYEKHVKIGYNLLYYLHSSSKPGESKLHVYEEVCKNTGSGNLAVCLVKDFKACQEDDVRLLCHLVTPIYTQFPDASIGSTELLNTIVACIDSAQLQDLICDILQGNLVIFKKETVATALEKTLDWETFEQYCVWQLLDAHDFEVELLIPVLPKLNYRDHPEALASMVLLLKLERASIELLKPLFCRNCKNGDRFTSAILSYWALQDEGHLADLTKTLLVRATSTAKRLRQRQQTNKNQTNPTPDKLLGHLDALKQQVASKQTMFFSQEAVLQGLQTIQSACTDAQKAKFSDLFSLADELDDMSSRTTRSRLARRSPGSASPRGKKSVQNNEPESSSESEQDDEVIITKPKPAKRRKKSSAVTVGSDSD